MLRWTYIYSSILLVSLLAPLYSQSTLWRDPSPHTTQLVSVDKDVRLKVLDWGGSGRPVILSRVVLRIIHLVPASTRAQHRAEQEREQTVKQADLQQQRDAQNAAVLNAIAQHGLMAFTEPMSDTEEWNLEYYSRSAHKFMPAELTEAGECVCRA